MNPHDLIRMARQLASGDLGSGRGRPRQAELRRAVSTAYYAMFHALALTAAPSPFMSCSGRPDTDPKRHS